MVSGVSNSSSNISQMMQTMTQSMQQRQDGIFKKIDSSGDAKIDKTEFSAMAKKMSEMSGSSINVDDVFSKYDANKDGSMNKDELVSFMKDNAPAPPAGMAGGMGQMNAAGEASAGGAAQSGGSSKSSSASNDPKDTNQDGIVSAAEELAYDLKHNILSAYGSNSSDPLSQLMDMLQKNSASDSNGASTEARSKNDYISKLLDTLKNISNSNGDGSSVNVSLISITA